ncbi:MAG: LysR family transcriptional regulator [Lentisphaeria bacterium]|nr:LysR family transcriptional regulator [Lentisphaeria bacterium]
MVTFNQLKNFLLLAEILHFARAAQKMGITQAALSRDIKKLETEIGCQLFDRSDK